MHANRKGFSHVELLLVVVAVAAIGLVGLRVMSAQRPANIPADQASQTAKDKVSENVPEVNEPGDLQPAEEFLQGTDIDSELDTSEIDAALQN